MCLTYVIIQRCAGVCEQANRGGLGLGGDALLMVCAAVVLAGGIAAPAPGVAESGGPVGGVGSRNAVPCLLELDSPVTLWGGFDFGVVTTASGIASLAGRCAGVGWHDPIPVRVAAP